MDGFELHFRGASHETRSYIGFDDRRMIEIKMFLVYTTGWMMMMSFTKKEKLGKK